MGSGSGTDNIEQERQALLAEGDQQPRTPRRSSASLERLNVLNEALPQVYYVIIGRGPMAVVNLCTLTATRWGLDRIGDHTILHIGFPNPWPRYVRHGLGQPNHLLSLPGFARRHQPSNADPAMWTVDGGLDSQEFGRRVENQFTALRQANNVELATEWVALIQSRRRPGQVDRRIRDQLDDGQQVHATITECIRAAWPPFEEDEAPYRLCLFDPERRTARLVYASAIDICTGPGRPNVAPPADGDTPEILEARTPPWLYPELWSQEQQWIERRTLNGVDAIRDEVPFRRNQRICVTAGGGVGLNAAEKSRNNDCALDWFGRTELIPILRNPRNATYLRWPGRDVACNPGNLATFGIHGEDDLIAHTQTHRMGRGAIIRSVSNNAADGVDVLLGPPGNAQPNASIIRDYWGNHSALHRDGYWEFSAQYTQAVRRMRIQASVAYSRLVIPNGQSTREVGQPQKIAGEHLGFRPIVRNGRMVALETADGHVRVLGAACNDYPGFDIGTWQRANSPMGGRPEYAMWHYHSTLPICAVPDGFIICGANTAIANHFFSETNRNVNVNTMTFSEIYAVVDDRDLARRIVEERHGNNGYRDLADLQQTCGSQAPALAGLQYAY